MPHRHPRHRLAAVVAASLVGLFVVVVGAASSQAVSVRVGALAAGPGPTQVGPADPAAQSDDAAAPQELAGRPPTTGGTLEHGLLPVEVTAPDGHAGAAPQRPTGRAPPAD